MTDEGGRAWADKDCRALRDFALYCADEAKRLKRSAAAYLFGVAAAAVMDHSAASGTQLAKPTSARREAI